MNTFENIVERGQNAEKKKKPCNIFSCFPHNVFKGLLPVGCYENLYCVVKLVVLGFNAT